MVPEILSQKVKTFTDGTIIKECLEAVVDVSLTDKNKNHL
jgi:hypothetical protein